MAVQTGGKMSWRVLAVFCGQRSEGVKSAGPIDELLHNSLPHIEVLVLKNKSLAEVGEQILVWQPNVIFFTGENGKHSSVGKLPVLTWRTVDDVAGGQDDFALLFQGVLVDTVYFDAPGCSRHADTAHTMGVKNVVFWASVSVQASHAAHFSHAFFSALRDRLSTTMEAFALATQTTQAHCASLLQNEHLVMPTLPQLLSDSAPSLPDMDSIPPPRIPGAHIVSGNVAGISGWEDLRLLAPHAELRLLLCGPSSLVDSKRLSALGLALRALLVQEMRGLVLERTELAGRVPPQLAPGAAALRCTLMTASGSETDVVLGGLQNVLDQRDVVQLALRHTLVADSLSLQVKLPPIGAPLPLPKSVNHVAHGCSLVDIVVVTSVWAVGILRSLCQDPASRGLVSLGIAAVGGAPTAAFSQSDAARFSAFAPSVSKPVGGKKAAPAGGRSAWQEPMHEDSVDSWGADDDEDYGRKKRKRQRSRLADEVEWGEDQPRVDIPYVSDRRGIIECSEREWMEDYCSFCSSQMGRRVTPETWPDAVLNGVPLDVFNLYREVVTRGGFGMGNGINWKGQIFPKMRNYTPSHKMTGIGNALKTKYQQLLLEYEHAHPEDVTTDKCALCGGGEEVATDWVSCDHCNTWVHFSCDDRGGLGAFKDYAKTDGRSYVCQNCSG